MQARRGSVEDSIMNSDLGIPHHRKGADQSVIRKGAVGRDFVRNMTHELRTPLNAIIGLCQCLELDPETPLNEKQRDTVRRMERNAHALSITVNRLLESLRSGKYE